MNEAASFEIGQIVARGARKPLDQRFLVALLPRIERDCGDDHEDALLAAVVSLCGPNLGPLARG